MKRDKFIKLAATALPCLAAAALLVWVFASMGKCPYARNISKVDVGALSAIEDSVYICDIEEAAVDQADPFELAKIRGWIVEPKGEYYGVAAAKLLLYSDSAAYSVKVFREKRADVIYMDQSDPDSRELNVGFTAYFSIDEIEKGEYTIGFLVKDGTGERAVLTSDTFTA